MNNEKTFKEANKVMDIIYHFLFWIYKVLSAFGLGSAFDGITDKFIDF